MRLTLADIRNTRIPAALGLCSTDTDRLVHWLNEAQERLLNKGKWWQTTGHFLMCVNEGCVTLPPQIATIESAALCGNPITIHDQWFEFLPTGAGIRDSTSCWPEANYVGQFPTFSDVSGPSRRIKLICDLASDVAKIVLVLGYDDSGNWIRTSQGGVIKDGELVALAQNYGTVATKRYSRITDLQLPDNLDGQVWLVEIDDTTGFSRQIGRYQYWETRPSYARYFIPGVQPASACCGQNDGTTSKLLDVIAKLAFIPVKAETDYLLISCVPALKAMMTAIKKSENEPDGEVANQILLAGEAVALRELNAELDHYLGSGRKIGMSFSGSSIGEQEPIENLI